MRYACAKTKVPFWLLPPSGPSGVRHRVGSKALNTYLWIKEVMNHSSSSKGICSTALSCYRPDYRVSSLLQAQCWNFLQLVLRRHDAWRVCQCTALISLCLGGSVNHLIRDVRGPSIILHTGRVSSEQRRSLVHVGVHLRTLNSRQLIFCVFLNWGILFWAKLLIGTYSVLGGGIFPWVSRIRRGWRALGWSLWGWRVWWRQVYTAFHLMVVRIGGWCHRIGDGVDVGSSDDSHPGPPAALHTHADTYGNARDDPHDEHNSKHDAGNRSARENVPDIGIVGAAVGRTSIAAVRSAVFATLSKAILCVDKQQD